MVAALLLAPFPSAASQAAAALSSAAPVPAVRATGTAATTTATTTTYTTATANGGTTRLPLVPGPDAAVVPDLGRPGSQVRSGLSTTEQTASATTDGSATTTLSPDGAWCWFGDPRAVRHTGTHDRTYLGWLTRRGEIQVAQFDHRTGSFTTATLMSGFEIDDHDNPSLLVRPDGRLMAFWSGHVGGSMYYRVSTGAESVASWGPLMTLPVQLPGVRGYTYPNPVLVPSEDNRLYLFWRAGSQPAVSWSDDLGVTWAPAKQVIAGAGHRPYLKVALGPDGTIGLAFTDGHPHERQVNEVRYGELRRGELYRSDGSRVGSLSEAAPPATAFEVVHSQAEWGSKAWIHDVAFDGSGVPVLVMAAFPSTTDHRYRYARRTAAGWQVTELTAAGPAFETSGREPFYSGGISLDHEDPSTVYLSRRIATTWEIEQWRTADGGRTWTRRAITTGSRLPNVRPITPRGSSGGAADVLWMAGGYAHYTSFSTGIAEADSRDRVRLSARTQASVVYGGRVTVLAALTDASGRVLPGRALTLWRRTTGQAEPVQVASATTGGAGAVSFALAQRAASVYEVRFVGEQTYAHAASPRMSVRTTPIATTLRISSSARTVRPGTSARLGGRLVRSDDGRTVAFVPVRLFRRAAGETTFRSIGTATTGRLGEVAWSVTPGRPAADYQLRSAPSVAYAAANSPVVTLRVSDAG